MANIVYKDFTQTGTPGVNVGSMQGVATDGTYIYVTSGGTQAPESNLRLYKYDSSYTEITHHDCGPDAPGPIAQANGIFWHPTYNRLFVSGNNWNGTGGQQSTVLEYDTNLNFLRGHLFGLDAAEMIVENGGYWWMIYNDRHAIDQFTYDDTTHTFTLVKTHNLPGAIPGRNDQALYQAILWLGDIAYLPVHGTNPWAPWIGAYKWTGTDFQIAALGLQPPTPNCTQSISLAPDGVTLLWAERIPISGNYQGNVVTSGFAEGGTKVLDYFRHARGGYSLRKLYSGYSGSAIRIRRSLDNAEADIGFDASGNLDETTVLAWAGAGDAWVSILYNQATGLHPTITEGTDLKQTTTGSQPKLVSAGTILKSNNKPAMLFDASVGQSLAASGGIVYAQPNIFFTTANSTAQIASNRQYIFDGDVTGAGNTTDQRHVLALDNAGSNAQWAGSWLAGGAYASGPQQHTALFNTTSSYHRRDGVQLASGDVGAGQLKFGALGSNFDGSGDKFNGYIGELLWFPETFDTTSVSFIEADQISSPSVTPISVDVVSGSLILTGGSALPMVGASLPLSPESINLSTQPMIISNGFVNSITPLALSFTTSTIITNTGFSVNIGSKTLTLSGQVLNVSSGAVSIVGPASLVLNGQQLNIVNGQAVSVSVDVIPGSLTLAPHSPIQIAGMNTNIMRGSLALTGQSIQVISLITGDVLLIDSARLVVIESPSRIVRIN